MNFSTNFLNKLFFVLAGLAVWSCSAFAEDRIQGANGSGYTVAVLPVENLSRTQAPLKSIQQLLTKKLSSSGTSILDNETLMQFMARHRMRYTGGLDEVTSQAFSTETAANAVLITTLELFSEALPPKIALSCRLVATGENPEILWIDSVGLSGDDAVGFLGIGLIASPLQLLEKGIEDISESLISYLAEETIVSADHKTRRKFAPKTFYRSPELTSDKRYSMAVVPFLNKSDRKNASEILSLQFVEHLSKAGRLNVIEPGIRRQEFLKYRIILDDGLSLANADILFNVLDVDLILTGIVMDYQDITGATGTPKVDFSTLILERKSSKIIWSSHSYNQGDDYVYLFDFGKVSTAHAVADIMTREIVNILR